MKGSSREKLKRGLRAGAGKGGSSFVWICKVLVPASFIVTLVQWGGLLYRAGAFLSPLMTFLHLPGEAALPLISGMIIGNYSTIAILSVVPFSLSQMTLITVFSLIAHNLVVEGIIQHQSGIHAAKITLIRIGSAILTVLVVAQFFSGTTASVTLPADFMAARPFPEVLGAWGVDISWLLLKILAIIMGIMILLEVLKAMGWINYLIRFFRPVMKVLGLPAQASTLWVAAAVFGLMFGGMVILEEARKEELTAEELERLHISIGINHSMVEDPALFLALGINGFWLWVPKLVVGIGAVQIYRLTRHLRRKRSRS